MDYITLGRSGLMVSPLCLGGNSWGAAGRRAWAPFGLEESRPFFRRALDLGINFFDTANAYNEGDSEKILGECLLGYAKREDVVIATKVGLPMGKGPNRRGLGAKHLLDEVDAQLERLGTDYIDLYIMHHEDTVTPLEETMEALTAIVSSGRARYVGASNFAPWRFAQLLMLADWKSYVRPIAMQSLYNPIQREGELDLIPLCKKEGIALTPFSPNARGILAGNKRGGSDRAAKDTIAQGLEVRPCDDAVVDATLAAAKAHGVSGAQVALAWAWARGIASPVMGATKLEQLDDAAAAVKLKLTPAELAAIDAPYQWRAPKGP